MRRGRAAPPLRWQWAQKDGWAQRTGAHARPKPTSSNIYLSRILCLCICVSQFVAERSAILLVLIIKLTREMRRRVWRGRDMDGEIERGQIREGGCEETFLCLSLNWEACRFTVPPPVALLNYILSGILWRIFGQTRIFAGFPILIINFAVYLCTSAQCVFRFQRSSIGCWVAH